MSGQPRPALLPRIAQSYPDAARRSHTEELFVRHIAAGKRVPWPIEEILTKDPEVRIALVEQIAHVCENLQLLADLIGCVQVDDEVTRDLSIDVLIVLVATGKDGTPIQHVSTYIPLRRRRIVEAHFQRVLRNAGNPVTGIH